MSDDVAASLPSPSSNGHSNGSPVQTPSPTSDLPSNSVSRPSSSRALVPTPLSTNLTPKVAIATASSPTNDYANPSPVGGGPTSASYVVPPRPKPGRKPATDEPASKRKAQNRESQRAFRARKAAKLNEMQAQVESSEQRHKQELNEKLADIHDKSRRIDQLEALVAQLKESEKRTASERDYWKDRAALLESRLKEQNSSMNGFSPEKPVFFQAGMPNSRQDSPTRELVTAFTGYNTPKAMDIGCGNCKANGECACIAEIAKANNNAFMAAMSVAPTPARTNSSPMKGVQAPVTDIYADREIDITAQYLRRSRPDPRPSIAFLTQTNEADSRCGFCTDDSNCLCKDTSLQLQEMQTSTDDMAPVREIANDSTTSGPGSCADCQANPRQRAWCQRVAQLKGSSSDFLSSPSSRNSSISSPLDTMEPRIDNASDSRASIGCSEAYKLFEGRVSTDPDEMDWTQLKPISPSRRDAVNMQPRKYSALELDTAGVIATLGNSMQPLIARKSDGQNASIVRIAQEIQRSSNSPRQSMDRGSPMPVSSIVNGSNVSPRGWR